MATTPLEITPPLSHASHPHDYFTYPYCILVVLPPIHINVLNYI